MCVSLKKDCKVCVFVCVVMFDYDVVRHLSLLEIFILKMCVKPRRHGLLNENHRARLGITPSKLLAVETSETTQPSAVLQD